MINKLINDFSIQNLNAFLRNKINSYYINNEDLDYLFNETVFDKYENIEKQGEAKIENDEIIIITAKTNEALTDRTVKKKQYEIAKKILKQEVKDGALFVFYDEKGSFRFSFVKVNYLGIKREFTEFRRYTYFVSKERTNNTFIQQIGDCNFKSLDEMINAFSVEPLNKQFYIAIQGAFDKLVGANAVLELPSTPLKGNRKIYQEFAVRLIGRTIFCWFLKNKKSNAGVPLIPENWLSLKAVKNTQGYYHSILEKLFFLALNTTIEDRQKFDLPEEHLQIPFLNGGLFEPHPYDYFTANRPNYALKIPDTWFQDFFEILERYNFTIDERSMSDAEVSIDPEMLGTIFENLLAEIDPDTGESARKSTGSFYTPREIVDYMVEQSLVQYLKTKTGIEQESKLLMLFKESYNDEIHFDTKTIQQILNALSEVKILDPACGSGAFPMGAVQKIVLALKNLDPDAEKWAEIQLKRFHGNSEIRKKLEQKLQTATSDYARKLGVIQNAIYGVDIQPIATDISKLRSFLSLVIDENIDDTAKNRGIEPLPNLEFKFVTANTLIGLPEEEQQHNIFTDYETVDVLKNLRYEYLQSSGKKKNEIKERFIKLQKQAFRGHHHLFANHESRAYKIMSWNPFSNESSRWFDPKWMFGIEKFDIIIGNPPYVSIRTKSFDKKSKNTYKTKFSLAIGQYDLYVLFLEKSNEILKSQGVLSFIIPTRFLSNETFCEARKFLYEKCRVKIYLNAEMPFESANVEANSLICVKDSKTDFVLTNKFIVKKQKVYFQSKIYYNLIQKLPFSIYPFIVLQEDINLVNKILSKEYFVLGDFLNITRGFEFGYNHESITKTPNEYPLIKPESINKFVIKKESGLYVVPDFNNRTKFKTKELFLKTPKLLTKFIANDIIFAIDDTGYVNTNVIYNCHLTSNSKLDYYMLLGYLNSKLVSYWFKISFLNLDVLFPHIQKNQLMSIIIPKEMNWSLIGKITKTIINEKSIKKVTELENTIDLIVYKLFDLNYSEIKIIDPNFELSKEEYENYNIEEQCKIS